MKERKESVMMVSIFTCVIEKLEVFQFIENEDR